MTLKPLLPTWQRLSTKIVTVLLGFLVVALIAIGATLYLSWQLEGSSAAINETGSVRMQTYRLTLLVSRFIHEGGDANGRADVMRQVGLIDNTFATVRNGDPQRPLLLPPSDDIQEAFDHTEQAWRSTLRPMAIALVQGDLAADKRVPFYAKADVFVSNVNDLVHLIEHDSELRTAWLRSSQLALVALALGGTVLVIYLMFLLIVEPVSRLQVGIQRMTAKDFTARLPVETRDEFGQLAGSFNRMADRLQDLYGSLEERVRSKTAELADQNRELALLYDSASFLQRPQTVDEMCIGFFDRITDYFRADGGSVRVLDERRGTLHMVVHRGISNELVQHEQCLKVGDCLCGEAVEKKISVVHDLRRMDRDNELRCHREGFATVSVFHICAHEQHLGFFNLHFRTARSFTEREQALLETLGQLLGIAIENQRLASREREMAISEERNLVARDLHDSIAQGLNFLNLQVQMLDNSLRSGKVDEAADIVPALRAGVKESYEDVRELLLNYRSKLAEDDLAGALRITVEKFKRQTGLQVDLSIEGSGVPFDREQQLQMLFIVQEALSNIRKHAHAGKVEVRMVDGRDFKLSIRDDGVGFDADTLMAKGESHVGINIMHERAQRIHATLNVQSGNGKGTAIVVQLPQRHRRAA
jgi:two-component system nitrate/nitrite sensor histidine kinase NarX